MTESGALTRLGAELVWRTFGSPGRTPLILLHGWSGRGSSWTPIAELLAADRLVVVPDLRMHGDSLARPVVSTTIPRIVDDLVALRNELRLERVIPVGHSMGGQVATLLADRLGTRAPGLVVVDPAYAAPDDEIAGAEARRAEHVALAAERFRADPTSPRELEREYLNSLAELYDSEYLLDHSVGALAATAELLARRRTPTLALYSHRDAARRERELSTAAPAPTIVQWPGTTHQLHEEHPVEFVDLLTDWLQRFRL